MKRVLIAGVMLIVITTLSACARSTDKGSASQAAANTAAEQEVRNLNQEYDKAIVAQDEAAYERLYADNARIIEIGGKVSDKRAMIERAKADETKFEVGQSDEIDVKIFGDTAVVTGRWTQKSVTKGLPFSAILRYTTVYAKLNGKWQIVSDQVTPIDGQIAQ